MIQKVNSKRTAQLVVVVLCAAVVKLYYSTASVNQLRWILAPTTVLVELVSGARFEFESYAGYMSSDRTFVIAASCAGVNFLITAFLMLSLRKLWGGRAQNTAWRFIPCATLCAYLATLVANTVRISTALRLRGMNQEAGWLSPNQLHRFEGIFIYFGFLLLLFMVSEKMNSEKASRAETAAGLFRRFFCPLLIYYATTLGLPLANGAYRQGADFWEHSLFVLLTPLLLILPLATFSLYRNHRVKRAVRLRGGIAAQPWPL
jgi:exosortase K